tara:strand:- start:424 stop:612 length:189 start_codon:yes stop_codon:yes gene_type:complete
MVKKNTDLLNDPLAVAQTRYREQVDSFKNQYLPKPSKRRSSQILRDELELSPELLNEVMKGM